MPLDLFKKSTQTEHYWSLVIGKGWVQAGIWRVVAERAELIAEGSIAAWEEADQDSLIQAADTTLSSAASSGSDEIAEPDKVVFGLPPSWTEEGSIKEERLGILEKISKELELTPSGFVVLPEAIVHLMKVKEGAPLNGILVGISDDSLDISLVQNGKVLGTSEVARSMSMGADVTEGLTRLSELPSYPSRILLYDHKSGNLDAARQNLLEAEWADTQVHFLHTPKVEILPENIGISAVSLAGGAEVGEAKSIVQSKEADTQEQLEDGAKRADSGVADEGSEEGEEQAETEHLGFMQDEDVAAGQVVPLSEKIAEEITDQELEEPPPLGPLSSGSHRVTDSLEPDKHQASKRGFWTVLGGVGGSLKNITGSFHLPQQQLQTSTGGKGKWTLIVVFIGLLLLGGLAYWYLPKAQVTVYVAPKRLEKAIEFAVDPALAVVDQEKLIIPGAIKEMEVSGEKTTSTTGTKTVGEKARGKVTIVHVGAASLLKSKTLINGPNNLKFSLDEDVHIASSSGITSPSNTQASVTAVDIGAQYNLGSSTKFSVGNFSRDSFEATNSEVFSGGTSRSVSAVSEEDMKQVLKYLTDELSSKGIEKLKQNMSENSLLLEDSSVFTAQTKSFSNKLGEEASTLRLSVQGKVSVIVLQKDAIDLLLGQSLVQDIPQGFALRPDQTDVTYSALGQKAKDENQSKSKAKTKTEEKTDSQPGTLKYRFTAQIHANLLPKVNPEEIKLKIIGKTPLAAREYLATIPGFTRAEFSLRPQLPGFLGTLPRLSKNIVVEIAAER